MSFLDEMEKKKKAMARSKHPLCNEELRLREAYATGVALLMARADENLNYAEKEHMQELADALLLVEDPVERIFTTVVDAGADILDCIVTVIEKRDHKYLFILDLYRAARVDGDFQPEEQRMIELFEDMLDLKPVERECLKLFAEGVAQNDQKKMQEALLDAYHFWLELPMVVFYHFYVGLMPISEFTKRDLDMLEKSASQGIPEAQCMLAQIRAEDERKREEFDRLIYTDAKTGLMWLRNGNLAGKKMNWADALNWVKTLNYGGFSDWRIPKNVELEFLIKRGGARPHEWFNANKFINIQAYYYWSFCPFTGFTNTQWVVDMTGGHVNIDKCNGYYVWPVRSCKVDPRAKTKKYRV